MSGSEKPTWSELSSMKVDELRERCSELGLTVSGKKADLIQRILDQSESLEGEIVDSEVVSDTLTPKSNDNIGDAVDRLLARFEGNGESGGRDEGESPEDEGEEIVLSPQEDVPDIPEDGLPEGWTVEQWAHYGREWIERKEQGIVPSPKESDIMVADLSLIHI